jgi:murein DD-endopeptidase MepM/ murein hydrolase activator NlpD
MIKCSLSFVALLALGATALATEQSLRPGGIAVIEIGSTEASAPEASMDGKPLLVMQRGEKWVAVAGIPLDTEPGEMLISINGEEAVINVAEHAYREQRITVENKSFVDQDKEQLDRIWSERKIIDAVLSSFTESPVGGLSLAAPVPGTQSASFGYRRFFNDQPRSPHKGMDISAGNGEPIAASRSGVIAATGNYFFNGNTVLIDHGQGFVTLYCHMSKISIEEGQQVETGDVIGAVGSTGRVTGPHLHFGTYLNGTAVDPAFFLECCRLCTPPGAGPTPRRMAVTAPLLLVAAAFEELANDRTKCVHIDQERVMTTDAV